MKDLRPTFLEMALKTAKLWSERSEDPYKKVGACVLDRKGRVLSIGYNGVASKTILNKKFWSNRDNRRPFMIHAEVNALSLVKKSEAPYILGVTLLPCSSCASNIASYNIKYVVYGEEYEKDLNSKKIFNFYKIRLIKL